MTFTSPKDKDPGFTPIAESEEVQVWVPGRNNVHHILGGDAEIDASVVDSGNSPTDTIRGGNLIATDPTTGNEYLYDASPIATHLDEVWGVTEKHLSLLDHTGTASKSFSHIIKRCDLKAAALLGLDQQAAAKLWRLGYTLDDLTTYMGAAFGCHYKGQEFVSASPNAVTVADNGRMFITSIATEFDLPSIAIGLQYTFLQVADFSLTVDAGTTIIIGEDDVNATKVTFATANQLIGACMRFTAIYINATPVLRWMVEYLGPPTYTAASIA